jgi:hypothetical protein
VVSAGGGTQPILRLGPGPAFQASAPYALGEEPRQFQFCRSNLNYVIESEGT